jgi:hypothetical protein
MSLLSQSDGNEEIRRCHRGFMGNFIREDSSKHPKKLLEKHPVPVSPFAPK